MQDLFESGGCDGFVVAPTIFMFEEFGRMVVPDLQRRGVFRKDYAGRTMRENLRS
jgi:alkanesulfonate monooxygenase SsuD/methylene tetrahydromethanopterin reductase-like flavin-dependent oxidoreductase (luciferase family)